MTQKPTDKRATRVEIEGDIAIITFDRPEKRNAMNDALVADLDAFFANPPDWSCPVYVPVSELIYAAFRSKAKGLFPPSDEWGRRGL